MTRRFDLRKPAPATLAAHKLVLRRIADDCLLPLSIFVGITAGWKATVLVSAVAVTENGNPVLPPFVLTTNWAITGPIHFALAVIFTGALFWLARTSSIR